MAHVFRFIRVHHTVTTKLLLLSGLTLVIVTVLPTKRSSLAQDGIAVAGVVQTIEFDQLEVDQPVGLAYLSSHDKFVLVDAVPSSPAHDLLLLYDPATNQIQSLDGVPTVEQPINITFDEFRQRLLVLNGTFHELTVVNIDVEDLRASVRQIYSLEILNLQQPVGLTSDPRTGKLYILDGATSKVIAMTPDEDGDFEGSLAVSEGRVSEINLSTLAPSALHGIAFNPANGHLFVLEPEENALHEVALDGQLVETRDLFDSNLVNPQAIVFAPSGDQTDEPSILHLYVADRGVVHEEPVTPEQLPFRLYLPSMLQSDDMSETQSDAQTQSDSIVSDSVVDGKIIEIALDLPSIEVEATSVTRLNLVRTIESSTWSPSSPDPSGVTYDPAANQLIVSDSEVDEISALFGAKQNVFRATRTGSLQGTMSTMAFSREPTGISVNPANGHIFYSDDDKRKIFEVNPGSDRVLGTADDTVASFSVTPFAGRDPEDVAYDPVTPGLWIIDGLNAEVYHLLPGANGRFDGIAPDGDDVLSQFDTYRLNIRDPEGIHFNPATGNLILTSKDATKLYEVTINGELLRTFDVGAAQGVKLAGVTMAPSSTSPGATAFYVVDRMLDNDSYPSENDGRIYEFLEDTTSPPAATPTSIPTPTETPIPTSTPNPDSLLQFGASDDAYVRSDFPNSNYATATTIRVVGTPNTINGYLKFTVSGIAAAPRSAKLRLYVADPSPSGGSIYLVSNNYRGSTTPWVESGLRFSNAPAIGGSPLASLGSVDDNVWVEFDVTAAITGNGQYSFALSSTSYNSVLYSTKDDAANAPVLVIQP